MVLFLPSVGFLIVISIVIPVVVSIVVSIVISIVILVIVTHRRTGGISRLLGGGRPIRQARHATCSQ